MKRAYLYTRVSTSEQADKGYSLRDQEERLRAWCARHGVEALAHYQDDASAKTFQRPAFQRMLLEHRRRRASPGELEADVLLVVKWDRFSRDATGALSMIRELEQMGLLVQAIEQPIDRSVPEQLMMLAIYVAAPEVENARRSLNTKMGMRRAQREGRWTTTAPKGYLKGTDERGKGILVVDPHLGEIVREAFHLAAHRADLTMEAIRLRLRKRGLAISKNQFTLLLRNPVYKGMIRIQPWREEPGELVGGLHEGLVEPGLWQAVQDVRYAPTKKPPRSTPPPESLMLRGQLVCPHCGRIWTGSLSRSSTGKRYAYYHCFGKSATEQRRCTTLPIPRHAAPGVHEAAQAFMTACTLSRGWKEIFRRLAGELLAEEEETRIGRVRTREDLYEAARAKLVRLDEKYFEEEIPREAYDRLRAKYRAEYDRAGAALEEARLAYHDEDFGKRFEFATELFSDLGGIWRELGPDSKAEMARSIFPEKWIYDGERVRTREENPLIALFSGKMAEKEKPRSSDDDRGPIGLPG